MLCSLKKQDIRQTDKDRSCSTGCNFAASCLQFKNRGQTTSVDLETRQGSKELRSLSPIQLTFDNAVITWLNYFWLLQLTCQIYQMSSCTMCFCLRSILWRLTLTCGVTMQTPYKYTISCVNARFTHASTTSSKWTRTTAAVSLLFQNIQNKRNCDRSIIW